MAGHVEGWAELVQGPRGHAFGLFVTPDARKQQAELGEEAPVGHAGGVVMQGKLLGLTAHRGNLGERPPDLALACGCMGRGIVRAAPLAKSSCGVACRRRGCHAIIAFALHIGAPGRSLRRYSPYLSSVYW